MIAPPDSWGSQLGRTIFSEASEGDIRGSLANRRVISTVLGAPGEWATVSQVHGARVRKVSEGGDHGDADALWTTERSLTLAVFTADCLGIVLHADAAVGVVHAGWRGLVAGTIQNSINDMAAAGHPVRAAAIGPSIGPCCFEVGADVQALFDTELEKTTWGTTSVNLWDVGRRILGPEIDVWSSNQCTRCDAGWFSHRRDESQSRQAALTWLE